MKGKPVESIKIINKHKYVSFPRFFLRLRVPVCMLLCVAVYACVREGRVRGCVGVRMRACECVRARVCNVCIKKDMTTIIMDYWPSAAT